MLQRQQITEKRNQSYTRNIQRSQQTLKETLKNKCTNLIYKVGSLHLPTFWSSLVPKQIYLLGHPYPDEKKAKQKLKNIIWFTYRSNFKVSQELSSDTGWGCLLRVGQMLLASALTKFYADKIKITEETLHNIIYAFLDDQGEQEKYSLTQMMKIANKQFQLNAGEWFNIAQISYILENLQNKHPMKGSQNLKIVSFNQSIIFVNDVLSKLQVQPCSCQFRNIYCQICHNQKDNANKRQSIQIPSSHSFQKNHENRKSSFKETQTYSNYNFSNRHVLIIVVVRLGLVKISQNQFEGLLSLLNHQTSLGVIGGVPRKALYIVGHQDKDIVYLDPHYVQKSVNRKNFSHFIDTFYCKDYRKVSRSSLDPSMGLGFYLRNIHQFQSLVNKISILKQNQQNQFLSLSWQHNENNYLEASKSYEYSQISDDGFEA